MSSDVPSRRGGAAPDSDDIAAIIAVLAATRVGAGEIASAVNTSAQSVASRWRLAGREYGVIGQTFPSRHRIIGRGIFNR